MSMENFSQQNLLKNLEIFLLTAIFLGHTRETGQPPPNASLWGTRQTKVRLESFARLRNPAGNVTPTDCEVRMDIRGEREEIRPSRARITPLGRLLMPRLATGLVTNSPLPILEASTRPPKAAAPQTRRGRPPRPLHRPARQSQEGGRA